MILHIVLAEYVVCFNLIDPLTGKNFSQRNYVFYLMLEFPK